MFYNWNGFAYHAKRSWLYVLSALILAFLIVPVFIVVPMSFSASQFLEFPPSSYSLRWYREFFGSVEWLDSAWVSLRVAALTVIVAVPLGTATAYGLYLARARWLMAPINGIIATPIIIPAVIIALGVFFMFAKVGLVNTITGLVLAHSVHALPFVTILVGAGLKQFDMNQEKVARSLGASRLRAFFDIVVPQISPSLMSAALLSFIISLDEVVVAMMISSGPNSTITRKMFTSLRDQIDPTIAAISTMLVTLTVFVVLFAGLRWSTTMANDRR